MKHLPTELLYLLKVYNYIRDEIGLDHARSRADEIRAFIANAEYLKDYPTILEYISDDKSMEDIITYINRNERTYNLLGEWRDREIDALLSAKGLSGTIGFIGGMSVKKEGENAYFLLPDKLYSMNKVVLLGANIKEDIHTEKILWLEFYKAKEGMALEVFDDSCKTYKVTFSDFECRKEYYSVAPILNGNDVLYRKVVKMCSALCEKEAYNNDLLNDAERNIMPLAHFFDSLSRYELCKEYKDIVKYLSENGLQKAGNILLLTADHGENRKRIELKLLVRYFLRRRCLSFIKQVSREIIESQEGIKEISEI